MDAAKDLPGVDQLAASIVSSVRDAVVDGPIGERFDVEGLDNEAALFQIAREEIEKALPPILEAVARRVREDLTRGLNA
jgi:hypothetical protein